jgi:hypothetical protein
MNLRLHVKYRFMITQDISARSAVDNKGQPILEIKVRNQRAAGHKFKIINPFTSCFL